MTFFYLLSVDMSKPFQLVKTVVTKRKYEKLSKKHNTNVSLDYLPLNTIVIGSGTIGTTRPIPPNQRSCLGCIWWKDMSNPKRLR